MGTLCALLQHKSCAADEFIKTRVAAMCALPAMIRLLRASSYSLQLERRGRRTGTHER